MPFPAVQIETSKSDLSAPQGHSRATTRPTPNYDGASVLTGRGHGFGRFRVVSQSSVLVGRAATSEVGDEARDEGHEKDLAADRLEGRDRPADVGGRGHVAVAQGRQGTE